MPFIKLRNKSSTNWQTELLSANTPDLNKEEQKTPVVIKPHIPWWRKLWRLLKGY